MTTTNSNNYNTAVKALHSHSNHSKGFVSNKDAHVVFVKSIARQIGKASENRKKVVSKARKSRQAKGWQEIK